MKLPKVLFVIACIRIIMSYDILLVIREGCHHLAIGCNSIAWDSHA